MQILTHTRFMAKKKKYIMEFLQAFAGDQFLISSASQWDMNKFML